MSVSSKDTLLANKKILLMHPVGRKQFHNYPDLGLGYLAASLMRHGVQKKNLRLLWKYMADWTPEGFRRFLLLEQFDMVGIKVFSRNVDEANITLEVIKKVLPDALRVVGGPHPSSVLDKSFDDVPDAHYAFRGECENSLVEFLDAYWNSDVSRASQVDGLIWRKNGKTCVNRLAILKDIDSIGFPCWDLLKPQETMINAFNGTAMNVPMAPIMLSRGCNYRCTFCSTSLLNGHGVRYRSIDSALDELELLARDFGIKEFQIVDANAIASKEKFSSFCQGLIDRKLQFTWSCPHGIRLEGITEDLVRLMRRSGCYSVYVGIESGSPEIEKQVKKGTDLAKLKTSIQMLHRNGIKVFGFFMIGFPGETREQINETLKYAKELDIVGGSFSIFTPFPGTSIYNDLLFNGKIAKKDLKKMDTMNYENNLCEVPSKELLSIRRKMFFRLYFRPRSLLYFLSLMKSPSVIIYQFKNVARQYFGFLK